MNVVEKQLRAWIGALDSQVGDTEAEIEKRRASNAHAVAVREDVQALLTYMEHRDMPDAARRAIERCLAWNPFVGRKV